MIIFKVILITIYLLFFIKNIVSILLSKDYEMINKIIQKENKFIKRSRFFSTFGVFLGMSQEFTDIKLVANSFKKNEIWYLRRDKKIGNLLLRPHFVRQIMAFNYVGYNFQKYMNDFFRKKIEEYYAISNDQLISFKIFQCTYSSFSNDLLIKNRSNPIKEELLFSWNIEDKFYDERFRYI